ncbi:MAG: hypothetical protein Q9196_002184 [Gyalolechia fulgens]
MGKRKNPVMKPQVEKKDKKVLPKTFPCLFCNAMNPDPVSVKLNKKAGIGELMCNACGERFQTGINYLSAAVDVYSDWIDACDAVAKEAADAAGDGEDSCQDQECAGSGDSEREFRNRW